MPNVSYCVSENEVHYNPLACEESSTYELVGTPSYPSEIDGCVSSFEMSFNYKRTDIDNRCRETVSEGSDTVTVEIGYNPSVTTSRTVESTYNYNGLEIEYSVTQTKLDAKITAKYNVTSTSNPTRILSSTTSIYSMEVDGIAQPSATSSYTFSTTGEHTVVYTLKYPGSISNDSFFYCDMLTSCEIGSGVTNVGKSIFGRCGNLSSITVDAGNTIYDSRNSCDAIIETETNVLITGCKDTVIPNTVTSIGEQAFNYCINLTSIDIPNSITSIGDKAFGNCSGLTSCTIGSGVTSIGIESFRDCSGLTSIVIPDSVTTIGNTCFGYCKKLTACTIGSGVTSIGTGAFYWSGIKSITIPDGVTSIGDNTFFNCTSLTSCTIGSGVTTIGNTAFQSCALRNIVIPNNVTTIDSSFYWCDSLTAATIGSGATNISTGAFNRCSGLTSITIDNANPVYDSRSNCNAVVETSTNKLILGCKRTVIPNTVTSIGPRAFDRCEKLTSIVIPDSITYIGDDAFNLCWNLESITSSSITAPTIEYTSFYGIKSGGTLTVPSGSSGYDVWMGTSSYYLGKYNWTKVEQ